MKKRIISVLLIAVLLLGMLPAQALAGDRPYGNVPILIGYGEVDYMADELLKEIGVAGLGERERIQKVYDWIITHCKRDNWDGTYYFDEDEVAAKAPAYVEEANKKLERLEAVIRPELEDTYGTSSAEEGYVSYDSNYYIASFAYEMMFTRTGNCAHFSALLALLLGHMGFDCRLIPGQFKNADGSLVEHIWNYVLVDGNYYWMDIRMDHAASTASGISHKYFMVLSTNAWKNNHVWDSGYSDWLSINAQYIVNMYNEYLDHQHDLFYIPPKEATCEEAGNIGFYICTDCRRCYTDEAGTAEIPESQVTVPALGHDWTDWTVLEESTWTTAGTRERTCRRDSSHVQTERTPALGNPFEDVKPGSYYEAPVVWANDNGITNGTSATRFSPKMPCTRAQVVTFLWRVAGCPEPTITESAFTDLDEDAYYYKAVLWALEKDVVNGISTNRFGPKMDCNRAQIVTILWRYAGSPAPSSHESPFIDVMDSKYYYEAVLWAVENGITNGKNANQFAPNERCSREQIVTFLYRTFAQQSGE